MVTLSGQVETRRGLQSVSVNGRLIRAIVGAVLGAVLVAGPATATLLNAPTLAPDHGQPGTLVHVTGFPEATTCPSVRMYVAAVAGITSFTDHRLSRLGGTVTYGLGAGQSSTGPLVRVPLFRFVVPALEPGRYMTYFTCAGAKNGWNALFEDSLFRVDPLPPGVTAPLTTTLSTQIPASDAFGPAVWLLIGVLSIAAASATVRRVER